MKRFITAFIYLIIRFKKKFMRQYLDLNVLSHISYASIYARFKKGIAKA